MRGRKPEYFARSNFTPLTFIPSRYHVLPHSNRIILKQSTVQKTVSIIQFITWVITFLSGGLGGRAVLLPGHYTKSDEK